MAAVLVIAILLTALLTIHLSGPARAQGIADTEPMMYGGLLADTKGAPLTGSHTIVVALHTAQTGGTKLCASSMVTKNLSNTFGRFRLSLPDACTGAVHQNPVTWVEVIVDGKALPRTQVGAVPYAVEADDKCPKGYAWDSSTKGITLCKRGKDEMVKVGSFWIDRYEVSLGDSKAYNAGKCDGAGNWFGGASVKNDCSKDFPITFPCNGNWSTKVHACSVKGKKPSRVMTWFQAAQACELAGKRLCSNYQWQVAAAGTHDPGSWPDSNSKDGCSGTWKIGSCNTCSAAIRSTGNAGTTASATTSCVSNWGAEDMVGNLTEWTAMWGQAGPGWATKTAYFAYPWPSGYFDDSTENLNGNSANPNQWTQGAPSAALRGGPYSRGKASGTFHISMYNGPTRGDGFIGARCCRH